MVFTFYRAILLSGCNNNATYLNTLRWGSIINTVNFSIGNRMTFYNAQTTIFVFMLIQIKILDSIAKLAALAPKTRGNLARFHGLFEPISSLIGQPITKFGFWLI